MASPSSAFWRRTPAALFPVCLGMIGVGVTWLSASEVLGAPHLLAVGWIGLSCAVIAFCMSCYLAKIFTAPRVVLIDMNPAPGRAAVSAGSMCIMLVAAALVRLTGEAEPALMLWTVGLVLHGLYAACVLVLIFQDGLRHLRVTPVLFLPFVGFVVAPLGGASLGLTAASHYIFWGVLPPFLVILVLSAARFAFWPTAIAQRAAAAITLAPTSMLATSSYILGMERFFDIFFAAACVMASVLLLKIRWLTAGGWTPLWGAFTFPLAGFSGAAVIAAGRYGGLWTPFAWGVLVVSTLIVGVLFVLTMQAWARGRLAPATGAATAG